MRKIVMIDFDGTITINNNFPYISPLRDGVKEAIEKLQNHGWICCLWTCRNGKTLEEAKKFLEDNGIFMDFYNESPADSSIPGGRKPIADIYIDDRGWPLPFVDNKSVLDWEKISDILLKY